MSPSPSTSDPAPTDATGTNARADDPTDSRSTLLNALIGAAVGIVLSFVPLSPAVGGAVAGYLEGGDSDDGLKVGAVAGVVMAVPLALLGMAVSLFVLGIGAPVGVGVLFLFFVLLLGIYTVGLGALGGIVGVALIDEL